MTDRQAEVYNGLIAINLREDDELIGVKITTGDQEIMLVSKDGMAIKFSETDVREMGRSAMGVKGISLNKDNIVVAMELVDEGSELLVVSENGYGKRSSVDEYRMQNRGGKGLKTYNINDKTGIVVGAKVVNEEDELMMINSDGVLIRIDVAQISKLSRVTSGVKLMRTNEECYVVSMAKIVGEE